MENSAHSKIHPSDELFYPSELKSLYTSVCRHYRMVVNESVRSYFDIRAHHFGWNEDIKKIRDSKNLLLPQNDHLKKLNKPFDVFGITLTSKEKTILLLQDQFFKDELEIAELLDSILDINFPYEDLPFKNLPPELGIKEQKKILADLNAIKPKIIKKGGENEIKIVANYLNLLGELDGRLVIAPILGQKELNMWHDSKTRLKKVDKDNKGSEELTQKIAEKFLFSDEFFADINQVYPIDAIFIINKNTADILPNVDIVPVRPQRVQDQLHKILGDNQLVRTSPFWDTDPFEYEKRIEGTVPKLTFPPDIFITTITFANQRANANLFTPSAKRTPIKETAVQITELLSMV